MLEQILTISNFFNVLIRFKIYDHEEKHKGIKITEKREEKKYLKSDLPVNKKSGNNTSGINKHARTINGWFSSVRRQ